MTTNGSENKMAEAMRDTLISPNEADRNSEPANVVDGLFAIARAVSQLAESVDAISTELMLMRSKIGSEEE